MCALRGAVATRVGGDPSFDSAHQPIRVAGSVYRKGGTERLVTIRATRADEYELAEFANRVEAMPALANFAGAKSAAAKRRVGDLLVRQIRKGGVDGTTRFDALSSIIGYWIRRRREGQVTREQAWEEIVSYNEACIGPPWPIERLREETERLWYRDSSTSRTAEPIQGAGTKLDDQLDADIRPPEFTDDAIAADFSSRYRNDWRYVASWGQWLTWTGTRWQREETLKVFDLARLVCRAKASRCTTPRVSARLASATTVSAVERLARADRCHAATSDIWDRDLWSLNTPRGSVDLRTGQIAPHDPSDWVTKTAAGSPNGNCPQWRKFLATITGDDDRLQSYLQRVAGYCLTGVTSEHALFFLYGTGANGKSVFLTTLAAILDDYSAVAPMEMLMAANGERHPTEMAGLRGARLVTATETEQGRRWAESKIKALTGGDRITAWFMRRDFFEFVPQFKLVVAGNHKPSIRNVDEAMRRRLHLVPFTVTIPPTERDKTLPEKLLAERDGILAWAVEGCLEWQSIGLAPPTTVLAATEEYFEAEDAIGRWLADACHRRSAVSETTPALFASWKFWAETNGEFAGSLKSLSADLASRGFQSYRNGQARGFRGLCLRENSLSSQRMGQ